MFQIEVRASGVEIVQYLPNVSEVRGYWCKLMFANSLFRPEVITIDFPKTNNPPNLGYLYPSRAGQKKPWLVKWLSEGKVHCRWVEDLAAVFSLLCSQLEAPGTQMRKKPVD